MVDKNKIYKITSVISFFRLDNVILKPIQEVYKGHKDILNCVEDINKLIPENNPIFITADNWGKYKIRFISSRFDKYLNRDLTTKQIVDFEKSTFKESDLTGEYLFLWKWYLKELDSI